MLLSPSRPIWSLPLEQVPAALGTGAEGLGEAAARERLERFGANRLPPLKRRPLLPRFLDQMVHFMALLLWIAGGLAFVAGTPQLGWAIWAVVLINGVFSFWQEFQAERTLAALTLALPRQVQVWRDGALGFRPAEELVAGDRVLLEEGDRVPADCRLVEAHELRVDLSVLTGESVPVARQAVDLSPTEARAPLATGERPNLVLAGSTIAAGWCQALVYATGPETEFGQVAHLTAGRRRSASTLEQQVGRIVHTISTIAIAMGLVAFSLSLLFVGLSPLESLVFAIGIIVANVPEGPLPTVTLALALNVQRMAVEEAWLPSGNGSGRRKLLEAAVLCSNARLGPEGAVGDPTETAMLQAALAEGLEAGEVRRRQPRRREIPFDSLRRRMSVVVERSGDGDGDGGRLITKGAPLEVLGLCDSWRTSGGRNPLTRNAAGG